MKIAENLCNKKFGRLLVTSFGFKDNHNIHFWNCICDCGKKTIVSKSGLTSGKTKSCGCYGIESRIKHNLTGHSLWKTWAQMRKRCSVTAKKKHPRYAGRGITICKEWNDFVIFQKWAIKNGWDSKLTIDRKDNNKGYSPGNCRFVTHKINCQNTSKSKKWIINGKIFNSSTDAAKWFNVTIGTISYWVDGRTVNGHKFSPKPLCYSF